MRHNLRPVAAALAVFGSFWGSWAVSALDVERFLKFSPAGLGILLSIAILGAAGANTVGGAMSERWGTGKVQSWSLAGWGALLLAMAATDQRAVFMVLFVASLSVGGALDVVMNVAATAALGRKPGRLMRFHGLFNAGAVAGAALTASLHGAGLSWRWLWAAIGVTALALAPVTLRAHLPATAPGQRSSWLASVVALGSAGLIGLAIVFACSALVEGGLDTWGVLFLRSHLAAGVLVGAAGYAIGQSLATASRVGLGPSLGAFGARRGASVGAGAATAGLVLEATSPVGALAGVGLALAIVGISACWPLLIAEAGGDLERPGTVVGGVTTAGYLGFLVGPLIVGAVSSALGLAAGLIALAIGAGVVSIGSARLSPRPARAQIDRVDRES